jgi:ornithine cyclodeaminase/alanine dehydrogenase-like protein (mu-crystallin family)
MAIRPNVRFGSKADSPNAKGAELVRDDHVVAEIGQVLAGAIDGRTSNDEVIVYKSLGHVVQDLSSAWWLYASDANQPASAARP